MSEERDDRTPWEGMAKTLDEAIAKAVHDRARSRLDEHFYDEEYDMQIVVVLAPGSVVWYRVILRQR